MPRRGSRASAGCVFGKTTAVEALSTVIVLTFSMTVTVRPVKSEVRAQVRTRKETSPGSIGFQCNCLRQLAKDPPKISFEASLVFGNGD
jgi:hypothetical protein